MTQPAESKTGLWIAIGGAVLALLLICCAGGVVAFFVLKDREAPESWEPNRPSASASAQGTELQQCVVGSWRYKHEGFTGTLHGSPSLTWTHDKGELVLTLRADGTMTVLNTMELAARDAAGAEHRVKRTGAATFTYKITGSEITYGPITEMGTSTYFINEVRQGASTQRPLWVATPGERVRCTAKSGITFTGFDAGQPYDQFFAYLPK